MNPVSQNSPGFSEEKVLPSNQHQPREAAGAAPSELLDLREIELACHSNPSSTDKLRKSNLSIKDGRSKNQFFNTTMQLTGLGDMSAIKSAHSETKPGEKKPPKHQSENNDITDTSQLDKFGGNGLSPVSRELKDTDEWFTLVHKNENNDQVTDVYNFVNISKDDAESLALMGLFKDFGEKECVILKLGNGRELKIPKLNLSQLQSNFPIIK
jgi:hypothetical protein